MAEEKALRTQHTEEAKEALHRLQSLIDQSSNTQNYNNTYEISRLSNKILDMKLRDDFFSEDLSPEERRTLNSAIIIART